MFATAARFTAALARQPLKTGALTSSTSSSSAAGLKTSASTQATTTLTASPFAVNKDGRLCSRNRLQHLYDPSAPLPPARQTNWSNHAARNRDAKDLAGF